MKPILYNTGETQFISNGLGRLHDCQRCEVFEERNGIFECEFDVPVGGAHFDELKCGMIIGVTHDTKGDIQPFDIVGYSKPINGVVTFVAQHISYRMSFETVVMAAQTSLADTITELSHGTGITPNSWFHYYADFDSTTRLPGTKGIPVSLKSFFGGMEGSILDTYGGEYEWDKWNVILHSSRGKDSDFVIRYGVNLVDYNDDTDFSETYNAARAYWGTENPVVTYVNSGLATFDGRIRCVPLDLTDRFESQPTTSQLQTAAKKYMVSNRVNMPNQNIKVDYARIKELHMENFNLCDTIGIEMPIYGISGRIKVVKTTWDVLRERYKEIELGSLQPSLAQALGI